MREQQKEKVSKSEATGTVAEDPEGAGLHGFPISGTDAPLVFGGNTLQCDFNKQTSIPTISSLPCCNKTISQESDFN